MKKNIIYWLLSLLLLIFPLGCSNNGQDAETEEEEKGAIQQMNEEIAHEIVDRIQTPINKAEEATQQHEERWEEVKEELKD